MKSYSESKSFSDSNKFVSFSPFISTVVSYNNSHKLQLLHVRLGHKPLSKLKHIRGCNKQDFNGFFCDTCDISNILHVPFPQNETMSEHAFELIHIDMWGPYPIADRTGENYFVTLVDDFSHGIKAYLLKFRFQVYDAIENFMAYMKNIFILVQLSREVIMVNFSLRSVKCCSLNYELCIKGKHLILYSKMDVWSKSIGIS